jgi:glycosyltransferase involved in cell wall biosynthesis
MATVLLEALAAGLPVITTLNSGLAVNEGVEGYLVPIRDSNAIAERLNQLASDPALLAEMSRNAKKRSENFTLAAYSDRLCRAIVEAR